MGRGKSDSNKRFSAIESRLDDLVKLISQLGQAQQPTRDSSVCSTKSVKRPKLDPVNNQDGKRRRDEEPEVDLDSSAGTVVEEQEFQTVRHRKRMAKPKPQMDSHLFTPDEVKTMFHDLDAETSFSSVDFGPVKETRPVAPKRPPPIILHNVAMADVKKTTAAIVAVSKGKTEFRCRGKNISVLTSRKEDWEGVKQIAHSADLNLQYHTYTPKEDKLVAFVMRGAHVTLNPEEIEIELKERHGIIAKATILSRQRKMENGQHELVQMPLFQVLIDQKVPLESLMGVKSISFFRVSWERKRGKRQLTQCYNCQRFGHAASNCGLMFRCVKCRIEHKKGECPNNSMDNLAECVNCGGQHPANFRDCKERAEYVSKRNIKTRQPVRQSRGWVSYAHAVASNPSSNPHKSNPAATAPSNAVDRLLEESRNLFGIEFPELLTKCEQFFTKYDSIKSQHEKRTAFINFASNLSVHP